MSLPKVVHRLDAHRWYEGLPASPAVQVGDWLFIAGQVSADGAQRTIGAGDVEAQARQSLEYVRQLVEAAGGTLDDVVDVVSYHKDVRDIERVLDLAKEYFPDQPPAWTATGFLGSYTSDLLVSIRAIAHLGPGTKECFTPPASTAPLSGGCRKGDLLFVAGQSAAEPDGRLRPPIDHLAQARRAYARMLEVVELAGGTVDDILDFTSFHQDIRGAEATLLEVYVPEVLGPVATANAATTSHIGAPGLQREGMLGLYRSLADLSPGKRIASTPDSIWWKDVYPIAGGARKEQGSLITIAGQVASASDGGIVAPGDPEGQAAYAFDCMRELLEGFGATMDDIVEVSSFQKDPRTWERVMEVGARYFPPGQGPAWTSVSMPGLWIEGYLLEISALAMVTT